jgi:hypothetical protein
MCQELSAPPKAGYINADRLSRRFCLQMCGGPYISHSHDGCGKSIYECYARNQNPEKVSLSLD